MPTRIDRSELHRLLGGWPAASKAGATTIHVSTENGLQIEKLGIVCNRTTQLLPDAPLPALFIRPMGSGPFPAVVYVHAHGHNYVMGKSELLQNRQSLPEGPYGIALAKQGIASVCIDLPCFGERVHWQESTLSKKLLWHGDTLFGMMLRELSCCVDYLHTRTDIHHQRIGALGLSMGATLSWWLAALDSRISAVAELCCLADLGVLVEQGKHDAHGVYMTIPGLLQQFSTVDVVSLIVPRPHLCAIGTDDPLTPPAAVEKIRQALPDIYSQAGAPDAWQLIEESGSGHIETPHMRKAVIKFLTKHLL